MSLYYRNKPDWYTFNQSLTTTILIHRSLNIHMCAVYVYITLKKKCVTCLFSVTFGKHLLGKPISVFCRGLNTCVNHFVPFKHSLIRSEIKSNEWHLYIHSFHSENWSLMGYESTWIQALYNELKQPTKVRGFWERFSTSEMSF